MDKITIENKTYLSIPDYANYKGVSLATVYNWIKENKVITKKMLRTTFVQV